MSNTLPKKSRICKRREYLCIQNRGRKIYSTNLLGFVVPGARRIGITVSKKVGNAVIRNRVKRLIREAFRIRQEQFSQIIDLVVIAKPCAASATFADISLDMEKLAKQAV